FQNDGAAGADGRTNLSNGLVVREVPWGEGRTYANRLAHHVLMHGGIARRDHPAVNATALFSMPVSVVSATDDFGGGFRQRFALIQRHVAADFLSPLAAHLGHFPQDLGTLHG